MKHSQKMLGIYIAVLCLIVLPLMFVYRQYDAQTGTRDNDWKTDMRMEGIRMTVDDLMEAQQTAVTAFETQLNDNLNLLSVPLRGIVQQKDDEAIQNYEYGCVIRKGDHELILPEDDTSIPRREAMEYEGVPPIAMETSEPFEGDTGVFWSKAPVRVEEEPAPVTEGTGVEDSADDGESPTDEIAEAADAEEEMADETEESSAAGEDAAGETAAAADETETSEEEYVLCAYRHLGGQYYYVYYTPASEIETFIKSRVDMESILESMETVYEGYFLAVTESEDGYSLLYGSHLFDECESLSEMGISIGKTKSPFRKVTIGSEDYMYAVSAARYARSIGSELRIVYLIPYANYVGQSTGNSSILLIVAFSFLLVLTVWVFAARELMQRKTITKSQRKRYSARRMRLMAASLGIIGFVVIMLFTMFTEALSGIYYSTNNCQSALDTMHIMAQENSAHEERLSQQ